jgi:hypothetical protein
LDESERKMRIRMVDQRIRKENQERGSTIRRIRKMG